MSSQSKGLKAFHARAKENNTYLKIWLAIAFAIAIGGEWETVGLITLAVPHVIPAFNRFRGKGVENKARGFWVGRAILVAVFSAMFAFFAIDEGFTFALLFSVIGIISARMYLRKDKVLAAGVFASLFFLEFGTHVTIAVALLVTLFAMFPREIVKKNKADDVQTDDRTEDAQQSGTGLMAAVTQVVGAQWTEFQSRYPQFADFASFKARIDALLTAKDQEIRALRTRLGLDPNTGEPLPTHDETSQFGPVEEFGPVPAQPQDDDRTQVLRPIRPQGPVQPHGDDRPYQGPETTAYHGDTTYGQQPYPQAPVHGDPSLKRPTEGPHQD